MYSKKLLGIGKWSTYKWYNDFKNSSTFLKMVVVFSYVYDKVDECCKFVYDEVPIIRDMYDETYKFMEDAYCGFFGIRQEPRDNIWYTITVAYPHHKSDGLFTYQIRELTQIVKEPVTDESFQEYARIGENVWSECPIPDDTIHNSLITIKYFNYYLTQSFTFPHVVNPYSKDAVRSISNLTKSNVRFLSIEYHHDEMEEPIAIELNPNYYVVGNNLFNSTFIKRYLEHQGQYYVFDNKYKVTIMDESINMVELDIHKSITLDKNLYVINQAKEE